MTFTFAASPAQIVVDFDPFKTTIEYVLGAVLHTVHGTFKLESGRISFDPATAAISGQVLVSAESGDSGSGARDLRMKRDILEVDRYPEIAFTPDKLMGRPSDLHNFSFTVSGWFSIRGQRHELGIPVNAKISGTEFSLSGHFKVPYVAWGMKNPSTFILRVNDYVDVSIDAAGRVKSHRGS